MKWFPVRVHTHYSLLRSTSKPEDIVERCKELGFDSCVVTDHNTVASAVPFTKAAQKAGVKPILGAEITICENGNPNVTLGTITLIAKNRKGWVKILNVISRTNDPDCFSKEPKISFFELIKMVDENVLCVTGYVGSHLSNSMFEKPTLLYIQKTPEGLPALKREWRDQGLSLLVEYMRVFGDNLFVERSPFIHDSVYDVNDGIIEDIAGRAGARQFLGCGSYYTKKENAEDHRIILCTKMKCQLERADAALEDEDNQNLSQYFTSENFHIPTGREIRKDFDKEWIKNTLLINDLCEEYTILDRPKLPEFQCPDGLSEMDYLKKLCRDGWQKKLTDKGKACTEEGRKLYGDRIKAEFEVIEKANLAGYFLIVQDYVNHFKNQGYLIGPGRGSAGGCLVSYLLNIISLDPIEYGLIFERFYNEGRNTEEHVSMPDIDIDFPTDIRDDVIQYLKDKYGEHRVCQMVTFGRLTGRSVLKTIMRAKNTCSFDMMNEVTKKIPDEAAISDQLKPYGGSTIKWALDNEPGLTQFVYKDDQGNLRGEMADVFEQGIRLEGTYQTQGKHAAGVIVASINVDDIAPMVKSTRGEDKIAGMEMGDLESVGLVKFDILGISLLKKISETVDDVNTEGYEPHYVY